MDIEELRARLQELETELKGIVKSEISAYKLKWPSHSFFEAAIFVAGKLIKDDAYFEKINEQRDLKFRIDLYVQRDPDNSERLLVNVPANT